MTQAEFDHILDMCKPVPLIALQCGMPASQQEMANNAWKELGDKLGFKYMTARPSSKGHLFFMAEPK